MTVLELGITAQSTYLERKGSMSMLPLDEAGSEGGAAAGELVQSTLDDFSKKKRQPPSRKGIKHTPEALRKISEASRRNWARPEYREELREKKSGKNHHFYGKTFSEEYRAKLSEAHVGQISWNKGLKTGPLSKGHRDAIAEGNRDKTMSEEAKMKISAGHQGIPLEDWNKYVSFEPYCEKFNYARKEKVRNRDNRSCAMCGKTEILNGQKLSVHHIDADKMQGCNGKGWFLVSLCTECHMKITATKGQKAIELEFLLATKAEESRRSGL